MMSNHRYIPNLFIYGSPIERRENTKFLGVFIDEKLCWKSHSHFIISKLSRTIGIIRKLNENLTFSSLKTLYYSFIQPSLQYGIIFWYSVSSDIREKIFRLQKKAIRLINKTTFFSHTNPLFCKNKILKLIDLHKLESAKFIFHEVKLCNNFNLNSHSNIHSYQTRFNQNLIPRNFRTRVGLNFILVSGVHIYNSLYDDLKTLDSIGKFKCCLKLDLIFEYSQISDALL